MNRVLLIGVLILIVVGGVFWILTLFSISGLLLGLLIVFPFSLWLHRQFHWFRPNFRGDPVPYLLGLVPLTLGGLAVALYHPFDPVWLLVLGFGVLGYVDDRWGQEAPKGVRGHLHALLKGKPTTGLLKLIGGLILAALIAWQQAVDGLGAWGLGLGTLLIALTANFFNLLDLRPGRAASLFLVVAFVPLILLMRSNQLWTLDSGLWTHPALWIYLGVFRILPLDRRGQGMMGDVGSNLIGATAGVLLLQTTPLWFQAVLVLGLLSFHLWAERASFSDWIERHPWARQMDRLTGVR